MKVKTLKRQNDSRECTNDVRRQSRNLNPQHHPHQRAREYTRALQASKLERMFAKPLVGNLGNGHGDAVTCLAVSKNHLLPVVSGSADGSVHLWDLTTRKSVAQVSAHSRSVTGVQFLKESHMMSCSQDGTVQQWSMGALQQSEEQPAPVQSWKTTGTFQSMSVNSSNDTFVTASDEAVQVWSLERAQAIQTHNDLWGSADSVTCVRCHPTEDNWVIHASADRGIGLHDTRTQQAMSKTILKMRTNDLQWNPMEPMNVLAANEDFNVYQFDVRQLQRPLQIYKGHVNAVMSVSWSPTGREFCTGGYDCTMRMFSTQPNRCRDVYHTKRMQKIWSVAYTQDSDYILSASDDTNVRLWKANSSATTGQMTSRQEDAVRYRRALQKQYQHVPEIRRIQNSRKIPKAVRNQRKQAEIVKKSQERKLSNRVKYEKDAKFRSDRDKVVVQEME